MSVFQPPQVSSNSNQVEWPPQYQAPPSNFRRTAPVNNGTLFLTNNGFMAYPNYAPAGCPPDAQNTINLSPQNGPFVQHFVSPSPQFAFPNQYTGPFAFPPEQDANGGSPYINQQAPNTCFYPAPFSFAGPNIAQDGLPVEVNQQAFNNDFVPIQQQQQQQVFSLETGIGNPHSPDSLPDVSQINIEECPSPDSCYFSGSDIEDNNNPKLEKPAQKESDLGFKYHLEAPISTRVRLNEDRLTFINKGQYYPITLEYTPTPDKPIHSKAVKIVIMLVFRDGKSPEEEEKAWQLWSSRQPSPGKRIIEVDTKTSHNISGVEEIAQNAVSFCWGPSQPAKVNVAVHCLSNEFSHQKGVKGLPLHIQIDCYEISDNKKNNEDQPTRQLPVHRGYTQVKVFCDKGAERKARDEEKKASKRQADGSMKLKAEDVQLHPPCERSAFNPVANLQKVPTLINLTNHCENPTFPAVVPETPSICDMVSLAKKLKLDPIASSSSADSNIAQDGPSVEVNQQAFDYGPGPTQQQQGSSFETGGGNPHSPGPLPDSSTVDVEIQAEEGSPSDSCHDSNSEDNNTPKL